MAKIVLIHGMNHQYVAYFTMRRQWSEALRSGIRSAVCMFDMPDPGLRDEDFDIVFYGDLFRRRSETAETERAALRRDAGEGPAAPDDRELDLWSDLADAVEDYDIALARSASSSAEAEPAPDFRARGARNRGAALPAVVRGLWEVMGPGISEKATKQFVHQLHKYLEEPDLFAAILQRVHEIVEDDTVILVGHSMGTIVGYEYLRRDYLHWDPVDQSEEWHESLLPRLQACEPPGSITQLVTLGAPIGLRHVREHARLTPANREDRLSGIHWTNVFDSNDWVASVRSLGEYFPADIEHREVVNGSDVHLIDRYLTAPDTGRLFAALLRNPQ